jgi:CheY-like chemotaxis protein
MLTTPPLTLADVKIPPALIDAVRNGDCVAFVGAGFSAPAVPTWTDLLRQMAERVEVTAHRTEILTAIGAAKTPLDFEMAGQLLRDALGARFDDVAAEVVGRNPEAAEMADRRRLLAEIPFAGVLTTNIDPFIEGSRPCAEVYRSFLRPQRYWWSQSTWQPGGYKQHVVKLHVDVLDVAQNRLVLARSDYRRRLYQSSDYATFLRTVFATRTVLFLGVSFTDAYLNEVRSEVLAMLEPGKGEAPGTPIAYAVMCDVGSLQGRYFREREGIEVLSYDSLAPAGHTGFDDILRAIHQQTSTVARLGAALRGKSILWLDAHPENNAEGRPVFDQAAAGSVRVEQVRQLDEAVDLLATRTFDLVITHYGRDSSPPVAIRLLQAMRRNDHRAPVIVFASEWDAPARRREVMRLGAVDYIVPWADLFRRIVDVLHGA